MHKFMIKSLFILLLTAISFQLAAADTAEIKKLYGILLAKKPNDAPNGQRWPHRTILYKALGIDPATMPDSTIARRIQLGWQELSPVRISETNEPPKYFHEILREALRLGYGALLLDAVRWGVDLNQIDFNTRHTLVDDLEEAYRNSSTTEYSDWLREYKQVLMSGKAKYFVELNFYMRELARRYDRVRPPAYDLYPVQKNGKWGWVNKERKVIVPLRYKTFRYFTNNLFEVSDDGQSFYFIDRSGRKSAI